MTIGLSVPAVGIGGALFIIAGPAAWMEIAGNPELENLPDEARSLTGQELTELYAGMVHEGRYYTESAWEVFVESYEADGKLDGVGGPLDDPEKSTWRGTWTVEGDQICLEYRDEPECETIFALDDGYVTVNHRNEINGTYALVGPIPAAEAETD